MSPFLPPLKSRYLALLAGGAILSRMLRAAMRLPPGKGSAIFDFDAAIPPAERKRFRENLKVQLSFSRNRSTIRSLQSGDGAERFEVIVPNFTLTSRAIGTCLCRALWTALGITSKVRRVKGRHSRHPRAYEE